jgi:hypothetical protein
VKYTSDASGTFATVKEYELPLAVGSPALTSFKVELPLVRQYTVKLFTVDGFACVHVSCSFRADASLPINNMPIRAAARRVVRRPRAIGTPQN